MAGRPTWVGAKGGNEQGGYRRHNPSMQYSSRDLASHTKLKVRYSSFIIIISGYYYHFLWFDELDV